MHSGPSAWSSKGRRSVTLSDVAALAKVSDMTVSRVVNGSSNVRDSTAERVRRAMEELGYIPNQLARGLAVGGARLLALVVADITHPWFAQVARQVEATAGEHGYTVVFGNTNDDVDIEHGYLAKLSAFQVDGVILAPAGDRAAANIPLLQRQGVQFVLLDREIKGLDAAVITGESVKAARLLTEHLLDVHGVRDPVIVTGPASVSTARERVRGFKQAMAAHSRKVSDASVVFGDYSRESGHAEGLALLNRRRRPDAVVAANSFIALGIVDAAHELGLTVPDDLALVTFDDIELSAVGPFLTCVERHPRQVAEKAVRVLLGRLAGDTDAPRRSVVPAELRVRRSCGC